MERYEVPRLVDFLTPLAFMKKMRCYLSGIQGMRVSVLIPPKDPRALVEAACDGSTTSPPLNPELEAQDRRMYYLLCDALENSAYTAFTNTTTSGADLWFALERRFKRATFSDIASANMRFNKMCVLPKLGENPTVWYSNVYEVFEEYSSIADHCTEQFVMIKLMNSYMPEHLIATLQHIMSNPPDNLHEFLAQITRAHEAFMLIMS